MCCDSTAVTDRAKGKAESRSKGGGSADGDPETEKEIETLQEEQKQIAQEKEKQEKPAEMGKEVPAKGKKIAIDPGHQGPNVDMSDLEPMVTGSQEMKAKASSGTQGRYTNVPEYELTLNISRQLQEELKKRGYETVLTREDHDTAISNSERALMAADAGPISM